MDIAGVPWLLELLRRAAGRLAAARQPLRRHHPKGVSSESGEFAPHLRKKTATSPLQFGALTWPGDLDLASDAMHKKAAARAGSWLRLRQ